MTFWRTIRNSTFAGAGVFALTAQIGAKPPAKPKPPLKVKPVATTTASAKFEGRDNATQGNWFGKYGKEAFSVAVQHGKSSYQLPTISIWRGKGERAPSKPNQPISEGSDHNQFEMTDWDRKIFVDDKRVPQRGPGMTERHATVFTVHTPPMIFRVDIKDNKPHRLSFYVLDYLRKKKAMQVEIKALNGTVLDSRRIDNYSNGAYLRYRVRGSIYLVLSPLDKADPELSGVFVDPA